MKISPTALREVFIIEPEVMVDERGTFFESFNERRFAELTGIEARFVQDNHSRSLRNVVRGLHYQIRHTQGKLVRVVSGEVFDVAVDMRRNSPTFGSWTGVVLSADNRRQTWIPPGFAHGFAVLSEAAEVLYKTTDYFAPEHARAVCWNDPSIGIKWPLTGVPLLSEKDRNAPPLDDAEVFE
ncbi:dTDP-4-dehydrorhamnose 3,5-epimerase [Noviherbaspirillum sp.]|uniref:dTDP-4-dehydrorhamnose 3,5-epimerase n=1 Tax=Noviherbaspirillum sp. TaxID=1926288 RepID=UPI002FE2ED5D